MALQYVGGATATKAGATSGNTTISLTALTGGIATSAQAGDVVIAGFATGSTADRTLLIQDPSGTAYTLVGSELYSNGTSYDTNLRVGLKELTAADASVTFGPTGNAADAGAMFVHVWRGEDETTILDVTAVTATGTGTGRPDPGAITPSTNGAVIICIGAGAAATGAVFTAAYLSNFRTATSVDTNDAMIGVGSVAWSSGAYNPAVWTGGSTVTSNSWAAVTLALRPGAVLGSVTEAASATDLPDVFSQSVSDSVSEESAAETAASVIGGTSANQAESASATDASLPTVIHSVYAYVSFLQLEIPRPLGALYYVSQTDALTAGTSDVGTLNKFVSALDAASAAHTQSGLVTFPGAVSDALAILASQSTTAVFVSSQADNSSSSAATSGANLLLYAVSGEAASGTSSASNTAVTSATDDESGDAFDAAGMLVTTSAAASDTELADDTASVAATFAAARSEPTASFDEPDATATLGTAVSDAGSASATASSLAVIPVDLDDAVSVSDFTSALVAGYVSAMDAAAAEAFQSVLAGFVVSALAAASGTSTQDASAQIVCATSASTSANSVEQAQAVVVADTLETSILGAAALADVTFSASALEAALAEAFGRRFVFRAALPSTGGQVSFVVVDLAPVAQLVAGTPGVSVQYGEIFCTPAEAGQQDGVVATADIPAMDAESSAIYYDAPAAGRASTFE